MKKAIILFLSLLISLFTFAQKQSIELELMGKYGVQSKSKNPWFSIYPPYTTTITGSSVGAGLNYKRMLNKKLYVKAGAGFNRFTADRIKDNYNEDNHSRSFRPSKYSPDLYNTTKYYYNNLMFTAGAGYEKSLSKNLKFTFGGDIVYLHSISQRYYIGPWRDGQKHKTNEQFPLALALNAHAGVLYKIKNSKFYLNPKIVLPVYQRMFADKTLLENKKDDHPQKWLGGAGLSISVGMYF